MPRLLLTLLLLVMLAACSTTTGQKDEHAAAPDLLPPPFRNIGLVMHTAALATGLYAPAPIARKEAAPVVIEPGKLNDRAPSVTWLGHSSVIIRMGGVTVLTDPVIVPLSTPASPLPVRLAPTPLKVEQLPRIDVILISHGDYDHLHKPTIRALARRYPHATVLAPQGVAALLIASGYPAAREPAEGETVSVGKLDITALPAKHETRRNPLGVRNGAAASWELSDGKIRILFIGDTAYGPVFKRIRAERGPYNVVLVPIGAYEPRSLVANMHETPEEAVQVARDLGAKLAIAIHWGTFALSPDRPAETRKRFLAADGQGLATRVLDIGQTITVR